MNERKWYLRTQDETFGPETGNRLLEWARLGRIQPGQEVSDDNIVWQRVEEVPFLDMRFSIDIGDGNPRGPFNRAAAEALLASGRLPPTASMVETRAPFDEEPASGPEEPPAAPAVASAQPVEKVIEKEVRVEVPVEKIVEVEKVVVDDTRIRELEGLLEEERRHTADLQARMDAASKKASEASVAAAEREAKLKADLQLKESERQQGEAALTGLLHDAEAQVAKLEQAVKDGVDRENKFSEQVTHLEDELRRLPQAASEVADIQAAVYSIMSGESEEIARTIEREKQEFEEIKKAHAAREERLLERRRELLKRAGADVGDMTRKALAGRPEDPRMVQLRKEYDDYRRLHEKTALESERKIGDLSEQLRICRAEASRRRENEKDVSQLLQENQTLRESLQRTEKDLIEMRQQNETLQRQQATSQQALMSRLAKLESPSVGTTATMETNQSREAKMVKLPGWMRLKH